MRLGKLFMAAVVACGAMATSASAAITAFWQQNTITPAAIANDPVLGTHQSWSLMVTTTADWASAGLQASLPAGNSFYNHFIGGNTKPNPAAIPSFAALEFDSYISGPGDNGTASGNPPAILGGHPAGQPSSFGGQTWSASWGNLSTDPPGTYEIARLTFPMGVIPTVFWQGDPPTLPLSSNTSEVNPETTTIIPQIPEPASLGLVAAVGLLAMRRRND